MKQFTSLRIANMVSSGQSKSNTHPKAETFESSACHYLCLNGVSLLLGCHDVLPCLTFFFDIDCYHSCRQQLDNRPFSTTLIFGDLMPFDHYIRS